MLYVVQLSWVLLFLTLAPAYAEIYKWVDRDGGVHFTDTIAGIPLEYRDRIEARTSTTLAPQSVPGPPQTGPERLSVALTPASMSYEVPLRRAGNAMLVEAVVDRTRHAHLLLDTGAELTVLSTAVARSLALNLRDAAVMPLRSASGVFFAPMMKVQSITVGDAAVYDVEVVVHDATPGLDGLLGMSFLDNFSVTISGSGHKLILTPLTENPQAELYGGHPQDWWSRKFRFYRSQIDSVKRYMGLRYTPELERTLRYFRAALEALDRQAAQVGVPRHWRD
jgi:clan AA aspartic protease (TIGR02281 family)